MEPFLPPAKKVSYRYLMILEYLGAQAPSFLAPAEGLLGAFGPFGRPSASSEAFAPSQDLKYVQTCGKYSRDAIDTFIFEIRHNLAKIWVCAYKNVVCMHDGLCAWVMLCSQICLTCFPDSIDTLIL